MGETNSKNTKKTNNTINTKGTRITRKDEHNQRIIRNMIKDIVKESQKKSMLIKCIYEIEDYNEIQIINNGTENFINEEILQKIKILNGNQKEKLILKKKFDKIGMNTIVFICEEILTNMDFLFYLCSSLKRVEFISFDTSQVTV